MIDIKKLFDKGERGTHKAPVKVTRDGKTFYQQRRVGRKEEIKISDEKIKKIIKEQNKTINAIGNIISLLENKKEKNKKLLLSPIMSGSDAGGIINEIKTETNKIDSILKRLNKSLNKYNKEKTKGLCELDEQRIGWEMRPELDYNISELELKSKKIYSSLKG